MARKTSFDADAGLFSARQTTPQEQPPQEQKSRNIGETQGRKGAKLRRINMAFSDQNYDFIQQEARRQGITMTMLLNRLVDAYRNSLSEQ